MIQIKDIDFRYPGSKHLVFRDFSLELKENNIYGLLGKNGTGDDGEPQGTGGLPVLDVLKKRGIGDAAIAVVRYFGGILLGAPGLVRAYSSSASLAVRAAGLVRMTPLAPVTVSVSYPLWGRLEASAPRFSVSSGQPEYAEQVKCTFYVHPENTESAISAIADICSGKAECSLGDIRYFAVPVEESGD